MRIGDLSAIMLVDRTDFEGFKEDRLSFRMDALAFDLLGCIRKVFLYVGVTYGI